MRRDRRAAAAPEQGGAGPLAGQDPCGLGVADGGERSRVLVARLQGQESLAGLGQHLLDLDAEPDLVRKVEAIEPAGGEHDAVEPALAALAEPRVDVAAQALDAQIRP